MFKGLLVARSCLSPGSGLKLYFTTKEIDFGVYALVKFPSNNSFMDVTITCNNAVIQSKQQMRKPMQSKQKIKNTLIKQRMVVKCVSFANFGYMKAVLTLPTTISDEEKKLT